MSFELAFKPSLLVALLITLGGSSQVRGGDTFPLIPHEVCQFLLQNQALIRQMDFRVTNAYPNLLDSNSVGLCGPVCAYNLVRVLEAETKIPILKDTNPARFVQGMEPYVEPGRDILDGMAPEQIAEALRDFFKARKSARLVELHAYSTKTGISEDLFSDPGKLHVIMLWQKSSRSGHYLIVKNINRSKQTMHVLDPNYPAHILNLQYERVQIRGSSDRIEVYGPLAEMYFGKSRGIIDAVIQVSKTPFPPERFRFENLWRRSR